MLEGLRILCIILPNELVASLNFPIKYEAAYPASMGYKKGTNKVQFFTPTEVQRTKYIQIKSQWDKHLVHEERTHLVFFMTRERVIS